MAYNISEEAEKLEGKRFNLVKDLTVLSGSIFGLSIALAAGRFVNIRFIVGEFLLFLSIIAGVVILYAALHGEEFFHYMMTSSELKSKLSYRIGLNDDVLIKSVGDSIKSYEKLMKNNQSGILFIVLKIIKIDYFYPSFYVTFLLGILFIFLSLIRFP